MMIQRFKAVIEVVLLGMLVLHVQFAYGADGKNGSIKGKIRASGVKSPENVVVYIDKVPAKVAVPSKPVVMDQVKLVFIPHVLPIVAGTSVKFLNSDPVVHNVMWPASSDGAYAAYNLGNWGKGRSKSYTFGKAGHVVILCNIHPEMEAHVLVLQNPFFAVVGKDGTYEIKNVPPGHYTVKTWYEKSRRLRAKRADVTVESGQAAELDFSLGRR